MFIIGISNRHIDFPRTRIIVHSKCWTGIRIGNQGFKRTSLHLGPTASKQKQRNTNRQCKINSHFPFLTYVYVIRYKINYKKTGRPGWDDQFNFARDPQPFGKLRDLFRLVSLSNHAQDDTAN